MLSIYRLGGVSEPVIFLNQCEKKIGFRIHLSSGLVERYVTCFFTKFVGRFFDIREFVPERRERVVGDRNQFDPVRKLNDVISVSVSLSDLLRECETTTVVQRYV